LIKRELYLVLLHVMACARQPSRPLNDLLPEYIPREDIDVTNYGEVSARSSHRYIHPVNTKHPRCVCRQKEAVLEHREGKQDGKHENWRYQYSAAI
jgi:hypothetical protein